MNVTFRWPLVLFLFSLAALLVLAGVLIASWLMNRSHTFSAWRKRVFSQQKREETREGDGESADSTVSADSADSAASEPAAPSALDRALAKTRHLAPRTPEQPMIWSVKQLLKRAPYAARMRRYVVLSVVSLLAALGLTVSAVGLTGRPSAVDQVASQNHSRRIILCLDVSGSALPFDREVIATYLDLIDHFRTEKIGMSIFNSTSRTVFPLTSDYHLVKKELTKALGALKGVENQKSIENMSQQDYQNISDWLEGTQDRKDSTSLIGDGLVSCAAMAPNFSATATKQQNRVAPTSIVFATDNVLSGTPVYSLRQALHLTELNSIRVDTLFTGTDVQSAAAQDLKAQTTALGGTFQVRSANNSVADLVTAIEQQKSRSQTNPDADVVDQPQWWLIVGMLFAAVLFLVAGWVRR